jgi:thiamine kinase-like enzyme
MKKLLLEQLPVAPVVFGHNDLLSGNIMYQEDKADVFLIDFEYGCHTYRYGARDAWSLSVASLS